MSSERVREVVLGYLRRIAREAGRSPDSIAEDTDLVESGLLDSMGFVRMVSAIEKELNLLIDWSDVNPEDMVTVSGLIRSVTQLTSAPPSNN